MGTGFGSNKSHKHLYKYKSKSLYLCLYSYISNKKRVYEVVTQFWSNFKNIKNTFTQILIIYTCVVITSALVKYMHLLWLETTLERIAEYTSFSLTFAIRDNHIFNYY